MKPQFIRAMVFSPSHSHRRFTPSGAKDRVILRNDLGGYLMMQGQAAVLTPLWPMRGQSQKSCLVLVWVLSATQAGAVRGCCELFGCEDPPTHLAQQWWAA
jgi:hypothetical protein